MILSLLVFNGDCLRCPKFYIVLFRAVMYFNHFLEKRVTSLVKRFCCYHDDKEEKDNEITTVKNRNSGIVANFSVTSDISQSKSASTFIYFSPNSTQFWFVLRYLAFKY